MSEVDRLSEALEKLADSLARAEREYIARTDLARLSGAQLHYLDLIHHLDNPTLGECARKLKVSKPSVTAVVDRLEGLGLVEKIKSDDDRRSSHLHLTREGRRLAQVHDKFHRDFTERFFGGLPQADLRKIAAVLERVFGAD